jgi:hypothetical protein
MFGIFRKKTTMATIKPLSNGRFGLFNRSETLVQTYARKRDAVRGATRHGLEIN